MPVTPTAVRSIAVLAVWALVGCAESGTAPRPRSPRGLLAPTPRLPGGKPLPIDSEVPVLGAPHPVAITFDGLPANRQIAVGASLTLTAAATDSHGQAMTGFAVTWSVSDSAVATIDARTGVVTTKQAGSFRAGAFIVDTTAWTDVVTVTAVPDPSPKGPPPPPSSVALAVARFDGAAGGPAVVSAGVPLLPGALFPGREDMVRVSAGGAERPAYVAGLASLHPDGSLRAVLVQFRLADLPAGGLAGQLDLGTARDLAMTLDRPLVPPGTLPPDTKGVPAGLPQAAALPSDPNYLVATDLVGPTTTAAANSALGGAFARYEFDFGRIADHLWDNEGANYLLSNYYDRALIYYAMWARTGTLAYWARAGQIAYDYRARYLEPNAYGPSPQWSQLEGLEKHYLLTGDEASRVAVVRTGGRLYSAYINTAYLDARSGESRIAARVLHGQLLALRLTPPGAPAIAGNGATGMNYASNLDAVLGRIAAWQAPDGSYPATAQVCGGQLNYMVGLLNDALIKVHDYYQPPVASRRAGMQAQVVTLVRKAGDYMWSTQWVPGSNAFKYTSVNCIGIGAPTPAPDLNNMIVTTYGWLYKVTRDPQYLAAGEKVFAGGVMQAYLSGTKQFNENYTSSFRYPAYR